MHELSLLKMDHLDKLKKKEEEEEEAVYLFESWMTDRTIAPSQRHKNSFLISSIATEDAHQVDGVTITTLEHFPQRR